MGGRVRLAAAQFQFPPIIHPVIVRTVAAAASNATLPAARIIRPTTPHLDNRAHAATAQPSDFAAPAPYMSALEAVQRARRKVLAESIEREKKVKQQFEQENECVICLDRPMSTVLQPCGHVQMCSRCCREHLALAESKSVQPQVRDEEAIHESHLGPS